jgi:hypothetical protein
MNTTATRVNTITQDVRDLARRAAKGDTAALAELSDLAREAGYAHRSGGWLYDLHRPGARALATRARG